MNSKNIQKHGICYEPSITINISIYDMHVYCFGFNINNYYIKHYKITFIKENCITHVYKYRKIVTSLLCNVFFIPKPLYIFPII